MRRALFEYKSIQTLSRTVLFQEVSMHNSTSEFDSVVGALLACMLRCDRSRAHPFFLWPSIGRGTNDVLHSSTIWYITIVALGMGLKSTNDRPKTTSTTTFRSAATTNSVSSNQSIIRQDSHIHSFLGFSLLSIPSVAP